jgi:hypothetical protein
MDGGMSPLTMKDISKRLLEQYVHLWQDLLAHCRETDTWIVPFRAPAVRGPGRKSPVPAKSKAQQALMASDLTKKRAGKPTKTDLSEAQLTDFAETPTKSLPKRVKTAKKGK